MCLGCKFVKYLQPSIGGAQQLSRQSTSIITNNKLNFFTEFIVTHFFVKCVNVYNNNY